MAEKKVSAMTFLASVPDDAKLYVVVNGDPTPYYTTKATLLDGIASSQDFQSVIDNGGTWVSGVLTIVIDATGMIMTDSGSSQVSVFGPWGLGSILIDVEQTVLQSNGFIHSDIANSKNINVQFETPTGDGMILVPDVGSTTDKFALLSQLETGSTVSGDVVPDIAARNAYDVPDIPFNIFVENDGDGNWALYMAITTGVGATFVKTSDPDLLNAAMSNASIKTAYESNANTNAFTDAEKSKLGGVATGATANDTDANLKNRANHTGTQSADTIVDGTTNKVYTATEKTKLASIASGATVNQSDATVNAAIAAKKSMTMLFQHTPINFADSLTYYFGGSYGFAPTTTSIRRVFAGISGTITDVSGAFYPSTVGSAENSTLSIKNVTTGVTVVVTSVLQMNALSNGFSSTISLSVTKGDELEIILTTPAWSTNPITTYGVVQALITN